MGRDLALRPPSHRRKRLRARHWAPPGRMSTLRRAKGWPGVCARARGTRDSRLTSPPWSPKPLHSRSVSGVAGTLSRALSREHGWPSPARPAQRPSLSRACARPSIAAACASAPLRPLFAYDARWHMTLGFGRVSLLRRLGSIGLGEVAFWCGLGHGGRIVPVLSLPAAADAVVPVAG